jgi:hypothetical protein
VDNCPLVKNPLQEDSDRDRRGDVCDNCRLVANADQLNTDHADDGGDACDLDDDNDFCEDTADDKPLLDSSVVGHRVTLACSADLSKVFGWDGLDSDKDGRRNCADDDDDNDKIPDVDDPCPTDGSGNALACEAAPVSCPVTVFWNVCLLGGCNQFLITVVSVINPVVVIRNFTIQQPGILILLPSANQSIDQIERALAGGTGAVEGRGRPSAATKARLEIWTAGPNGRPGRFVSRIATFEPVRVSRGAKTGESALQLTVAQDGTSLAMQRISMEVPSPRK